MSSIVVTCFAVICIIIVVFCWITIRSFLHNIIENCGKCEHAEKLPEEKHYESKLGTKRIPDFRRTGIDVPDISPDSKECLVELVKCDVREGNTACFNCIESRFHTMYCVHLYKDVDIYVTDEREYRTMPANTNEYEGYCLSEKLTRLVRYYLKEINDPELNEHSHNCRPYSGDWVLSRLSLDGSYNFICLCKYPHLLTNIAGPMSSCSKSVACNNHGTLDSESIAGNIDAYVSGKCLCEDGWIGDYDANIIGPYCRVATFGENPNAFLHTNDNNKILNSTSDHLNKDFVNYIRTLNNNQPFKIPNPCTYFTSNNGCRLERLQRDLPNGRIIFSTCIPTYGNIALRMNSDYLNNNGGRFNNVCFPVDIQYDGFTIDFNYQNNNYNFGITTKSKILPQWLTDSSNYLQFLRSLKGNNAADKTVLWGHTVFDEFTTEKSKGTVYYKGKVIYYQTCFQPIVLCFTNAGTDDCLPDGIPYKPIADTLYFAEAPNYAGSCKRVQDVDVDDECDKYFPITSKWNLNPKHEHCPSKCLYLNKFIRTENDLIVHDNDDMGFYY